MISILAKMLWLFLVWLGFQSQDVQSAGITNHIEIGYRATEFFDTKWGAIDFKKLIQKHQGAFQAGNPYPDAFYPSICRDEKYHDISEDTHWVYFMNATINYIRKQPQPWNEATEQLLVFMLGFVSHQVADASWHSLGIDQGFLQVMGKVNYWGSFDKAHDDGDIGGDVLLLYQHDMSYIDPLGNWYVPVDDLSKVYDEFYGYGRMPKDVIEECPQYLYLGRLGEYLFLKEFYPDIAEPSPFIVDRLDDYFLGGVDDMAVWTVNTWRNAIYMLEHGPSACEVPNRNPLYLRCPGVNGLDVPADYKDQKNRYVNYRLHNLTLDDLEVTRTERGVKFRPGEKLRERLRNVQRVRQDRKEKPKTQKLAENQQTPAAVYTSSSKYARAGWSLASGDVNKDGNEDLVIGAPGYSSSGNYQQGRVYIVHGSDSGLPTNLRDLESSADIIINGHNAINGRFGESVTVLDINKDGVNDLVVSAPQIGSAKLKYSGEVHIFLGQNGKPFKETPDVILSCTERYCNLGWSLSSGDLNGDGFPDLVIGSPFAAGGGEQRGVVAVIYAKENLQGAIQLPLQADWTMSGEQDYSWFGHTLKVKATSSAGTWLVVGAPTYRICSRSDCEYSPDDVQSSGRVYVYNVPSKIPRHVLTGDGYFGQFGMSLDVGNPYVPGFDMLAIGGTALNSSGSIDKTERVFRHSGVVDMFDVYALEKKERNVMVQFHGDRDFGRFGQEVKFSDINNDGIDDVIITAHLRTEDYDYNDNAEEGQAYAFLGGSTIFPTGNATYGCGNAAVEPCPALKASKEFVFKEEKSRFGSAVTVVKSSKTIDVVISAPHSRQGARLGGAVAVFRMNSAAKTVNSSK